MTAPYREPNTPEAELPALVARSGLQAAVRLALAGLACTVGGLVVLATTVLLWGTIASFFVIVIGIVLEIIALVLWIRHR